MPDRSKGSVLLVDDEPYVLESLRRALEREPFDIFTCASGSEALDLLAQRSVDVIVSDEMMPGMSGSELLTRVRHLYPGTARITLTGQASIAAAIKLINDGAIFRFLSKPCNATDLAQTIRHALQINQLSQQSARLLALAEKQRDALSALEGDYPGISTIERLEDGTIVLEDIATADIESLTGRIRAHVEGSGV